MNKFAIGDLHGCSKTFRKLVTEVIQLQKEDELYCLGDYVDRGPDSKGVIDFILQLKDQGYHVYTLRGNHDQMFMDSGKNKESFKFWLENGGYSTLRSFGIGSYDELDSKYKTFFYETKYFIETANYVLVHAGLNFKKEDPFSDFHSMMWIRDFKIDEKKLAGRTIVHGHTPITLPDMEAQSKAHVIDIDGGCVYGKYSAFGYLVAINLTTGEFLAEENCE